MFKLADRPDLKEWPVMDEAWFHVGGCGVAGGRRPRPAEIPSVRCVGRSPGASVRVGSSFWFSAQSFQRFPEPTRCQRLDTTFLSRIMS